MYLVFRLVYYVFLFLGVIDFIAWLYLYWGFRRSLSVLEEPVVSSGRRCSGRRVSIVIPARNELGNLRRLLPCILGLARRIGGEVIVVDDGSTDGTHEFMALMLRRYGGGLKYVRVARVPDGWMPKPYLLYTGYTVSEGDILVFLDADTVLYNEGAIEFMACSIGENEILSIAPRFQCSTRICRIVETVLLTLSHGLLGFHKVLNRRSGLAWFYGCCWAITRRSYEVLGTHRAVRRSIVEDRDLAEKAKRLGFRIRVARGWNHIATIWYGSIADNVNALARILRRYGRRRARAIAAAALVTLGYMIPPLAIAMGAVLMDPLLACLGTACYIALYLSHYPSSKVGGYNRVYPALSPAGSIILAIGILSASLKKHVTWRGRIVEDPARTPTPH